MALIDESVLTEARKQIDARTAALEGRVAHLESLLRLQASGQKLSESMLLTPAAGGDLVKSAQDCCDEAFGVKRA